MNMVRCQSPCLHQSEGYCTLPGPAPLSKELFFDNLQGAAPGVPEDCAYFTKSRDREHGPKGFCEGGGGDQRGALWH